MKRTLVCFDGYDTDVLEEPDRAALGAFETAALLGDVRSGGERAGDWSVARRLITQTRRALQSMSLRNSDEAELADVIAETGRLRALCDAVTVRAVGALESRRRGSARNALVSGAKLSGRCAARVSKAADQLKEMPNTAKRLQSGKLTLDNLYALGAAAQQCGASTVDSSDDLLDRADEHDEGTFRRAAREFAHRHDPYNGRDLLERQRRSRRGRLFIGHNRMGVIQGEIDPASFALLQKAVDAHCESLWRADGGRDGTPEQVRDNRQRVIDSIFELCTARDALTHEPLPASRSCGKTGRPAPDQVYIVGIGAVDGTDPGGMCEMMDGGPVSPSVLDSLSPDARIAGALFGGDGQPLWLGRSRRCASAGQHIAVAIRDRGCVTCGAPMHRCEIHHIREWDADKGPTDIDNLAALCHRCHLWLHNTRQRLVRNVDRHGAVRWSTRQRQRKRTARRRTTRDVTSFGGGSSGRSGRRTDGRTGGGIRGGRSGGGGLDGGSGPDGRQARVVTATDMLD